MSNTRTTHSERKKYILLNPKTWHVWIWRWKFCGWRRIKFSIFFIHFIQLTLVFTERELRTNLSQLSGKIKITCNIKQKLMWFKTDLSTDRSENEGWFDRSNEEFGLCKCSHFTLGKMSLTVVLYWLFALILTVGFSNMCVRYINCWNCIN